MVARREGDKFCEFEKAVKLNYQLGFYQYNNN